MKFSELDDIWKRIFEMEWESVCNKSKAIAAVIVDESGKIISVGRNKIGETEIPNPRVSHAEVEAVRNLDINKYPNVKAYTLYAALEPCPMCLGTLVMGGIRKLIIGAHDDHGGAVELLDKSNFLSSKHVEVIWMPSLYGEVQRGLQAIKELLYNEDKEKLERMLIDFSVYNARGVNATKKLFEDGWFENKTPDQYSIECIFNELSILIENN
ncbi:MAG: nucleoside deaminase [Treponema sp.]|nr:nucleoside deaminase [Treponema sp.]